MPHGRPNLLPVLLLLIPLLLLALSIPGAPMHIDEAWIGEQTWFLARDGYVHSNLFEGLAGSEGLLVVYHRLFVFAGSMAVEMFGWGLGSLRIVPLLSGLALLAAMAYYMRRRVGASPAITVAALAILLLIPIIFYHFKIYRPEMTMAFLGFASYMLLERFERGGKWWHAAGSAALAGLAALAHLYGLIFIVAGIAMLIRMRRIGWAALFALAAAIPFIPYLLDIASHYDLFQAQISNGIAAKKTSFTWITPFTNLLEEHKRLFRRAEIIPISILFILALFIDWKHRVRENRLFYEYTILLVILTGALVSDKLVTRYAIPLLPFFSIAVASALGGILRGNEICRPLRIGFLALLAVFAGYGIYHQIGEAFGEKQDVAALNATIAARIPAGERCLAPMNMVFDEAGNYTLVGLYLARKEHNDRLILGDAIRFAEEHRLRYIIMNRFATNEERIDDMAEVRMRDDVEVIEEKDDYMIVRIKRGEK